MKKILQVTKLLTIVIPAILAAPFINQAAAMDVSSGSKELYLEGLQRDNDFSNPESDYCLQRSVQGDNVAIFWHKEHGGDPLNHSDPNKSFDVKNMLQECERYYKTYVEDMKLVVKGNSISDKYKLVVFVKEGAQGAAMGGGDGDVATLTTPAPRVHKPPYGVLAHEMVHCFQHMSRCDGAQGGGINPEMGAQHGLWQNLPDWMTFENYHLVAFMEQTHLKFDHYANMYHTAHVMEYWAFKHGRDFYGNMLRSKESGDAITVYKAEHNLTQDQLNDEMFDAYRRFITWDIPRIEKVANKYANQHHTLLNDANDGWFQIAKSKCPQNYGYNGIKLKVPAAGTNVVLNFKGIAETDKEKAGWRYGFLAYLKDGKRVYGNVGKNTQDAAAFQIPENTEYLWLVVMGAPTEHSAGYGMGRRRQRQAPSSENEWPYKIKLTGTAIDESFIE